MTGSINLNYVDTGIYTSTTMVWNEDFVFPNLMITSPGKGFEL